MPCHPLGISEKRTFGGKVLAGLLVDDQPLLVTDVRQLPKLVHVGDVEGVAVLPACVWLVIARLWRGHYSPAVDDWGLGITILIKCGLAVNVEDGV